MNELLAAIRPHLDVATFVVALVTLLAVAIKTVLEIRRDRRESADRTLAIVLRLTRWGADHPGWYRLTATLTNHDAAELQVERVVLRRPWSAAMHEITESVTEPGDGALTREITLDARLGGAGALGVRAGGAPMRRADRKLFTFAARCPPSLWRSGRPSLHLRWITRRSTSAHHQSSRSRIRSTD